MVQVPTTVTATWTASLSATVRSQAPCVRLESTGMGLQKAQKARWGCMSAVHRWHTTGEAPAGLGTFTLHC